MSPLRKKWQGMWTIVRFNWPFYVVSVLTLIPGVSLMWWGFSGPDRTVPAVLGTLMVLGSGYFLVGSLGVSHWVYDRSELYRWSWLERALRNIPTDRMTLCHSGFDEASAGLREKFPHSRWVVLDHYDPAVMSEASIRRARGLFPPTPETRPAPFDRWPAPDASMEVILGLLAIHELRSHAQRAAWFAEARRCLAPGGAVVIAEHARDAANLLAFGPGFLHFHSMAAWRRSWEAGGFRLADTWRVTPFVRILVLKGRDIEGSGMK